MPGGVIRKVLCDLVCWKFQLIFQRSLRPLDYGSTIIPAMDCKKKKIELANISAVKKIYGTNNFFHLALSICRTVTVQLGNQH